MSHVGGLAKSNFCTKRDNSYLLYQSFIWYDIEKERERNKEEFKTKEGTLVYLSIKISDFFYINPINKLMSECKWEGPSRCFAYYINARIDQGQPLILGWIITWRHTTIR